MFKELMKYRDLLMMLTFRDLRIRYKQSAMGFLYRWITFHCQLLPNDQSGLRQP